MAGSPTYPALTAATPATVTLNGEWPYVNVWNINASAPIYFRADGTAAAVAADGTYAVPVGQMRQVAVQPSAPLTINVSVICSAVVTAGQISVEGSYDRIWDDEV